ncbi:hypothetical protein OAS39_08525 [Pirellulales bacterium]|nr:hypothetical protein [Pirellulales bacterium]
MATLTRQVAVIRGGLGDIWRACEVARLVARLCDPEHGHVTATTLQSDGGISLISAAERSNT